MGKLGAESPNNPHGVKLAIKQIDFMQKLAYMLGYQELNSIKSVGAQWSVYFRLNVKYVLSIIEFKFFLEKFKRHFSMLLSSIYQQNVGILKIKVDTTCI